MPALRRFNAKRDANEGPIVAAFKSLGCMTYRLDQPVDLLIYCPMAMNQRMHLVEVKLPGKPLNANQEAFVAAGWPVHIIRSADEAIDMVQRLRRGE